MLNLDLLNQIFFFNIGRYQSNDTYFNWQSKSYNKSNLFDVRMTRNAPMKNIFYCIPKADIKLVYYLEKDTVFSIGSNSEIQSQLLEALLEHLIEKFYNMYDKSLFKSCYGEVCNIFDGFSCILEDSFKNYESLDLIKTSLVNCKGCKKTIIVIIKKSLVEKSERAHTPLVYHHSGHALLLYIDKQFKVRGQELVDISY